MLGIALVLSLCSLAASYGGEVGIAAGFMLLALIFSAVSLRNFDERP